MYVELFIAHKSYTIILHTICRMTVGNTKITVTMLTVWFKLKIHFKKWKAMNLYNFFLWAIISIIIKNRVITTVQYVQYNNKNKYKK